MEHLKVTQIKDNSEYVLLNEKTNLTYSFILEFQGIEPPHYGDILLFHSDLLNSKSECYSHFYSFGAIDSPYGRDKKNIDPRELIGLHTKENNIILKRIYG